MIDVHTFVAGRLRDSAEAECPAAAVVAARTLLRDAADAGCPRATASFYVGGILVRGELSLAEVTG